MKYIRKIVALASLGIFGFFIVGCSGTPIYIETPDPKAYEGSKDKGREISASASGFQLFLLIPIDINDRHEKAYQLLKAQAGNGYITDVKIKESWSYGFVGTVYKTTLSATVYPRE